jgi:hypothetical protein
VPLLAARRDVASPFFLRSEIMSASHSAPPSDRKAAYTGLIVGAIAVFIILFSVVKITNASFGGEEGEKAAAESPK